MGNVSNKTSEDEFNGLSYGEAECHFDRNCFNSHLGKEGNGSLWKDSCVPYVLSADFPSGLKVMVGKAFAEFHEKTPIRWKIRENEPNYVIFIYNNNLYPYSNHIGCKGGKQELSFPFPYYPESSYKLRVACILHEMLHILGFLHEHVRSDRDSHVRCATQSKNNFKIADGILFGQYDYYSLMHYANGADNVWAKNQQLEEVADASPTFSQGDLAGLRRFYGLISSHFGEWHNACDPKKCTERQCGCGACGKQPGGLNCGYVGNHGHWSCCMNEDPNSSCHPTHTGFWHMACGKKCTKNHCKCLSCGFGCTYVGKKAHWSCCNNEKLLNSICPRSPYI